MKKKSPTCSSPSIQNNLFETPQDKPVSKFISVYRVSLVKDRSVSFEKRCLTNSIQARPILRKLIEEHGQPDREQFCVIMLNAKNHIIGLNIVSTGCLISATVHPREVLKPAIIANSSAMILCHNHPSNDPAPSQEDIAVTRTIVQAAKIMGILVHEHLIINMTDDDRYCSFADHGHIKRAYDEIGGIHGNMERKAIFPLEDLQADYARFRKMRNPCPKTISRIDDSLNKLSDFCKNVAVPAIDLSHNFAYLVADIRLNRVNDSIKAAQLKAV